MNDSDFENSLDCSIIPPETFRMVLVAIIGSSIAMVSFFFNFFLFTVLIKRRQNRANHMLYLIFLALIDTFLSGSYILLFPINLFMDFYENDLLSKIWWFCLRPTLALCHVAITASALLLTVATFERYMLISRIRSHFSIGYRLWTSIVVLFFALLAKGPLYLELQIFATGCLGPTAYTVMISKWSESEPYKTVYKFGFRSIMSTFLPFILTFYFNMRIIARLNDQHAGARLFRFSTSEYRKNIRSATIMLVLVSTTYLCCNVLNVLVTILEFADLVKITHYTSYYTYATDMVSLLTVFASAVRLPIYFVCNRRIRREVKTQIAQLWYCSEKKNRALIREPSATMRCLNSGNGFIVYRMSNRRRGECVLETKVVVGTGFDKVVLQIAMNGWNAKRM